MRKPIRPIAAPKTPNPQIWTKLRDKPWLEMDNSTPPRIRTVHYPLDNMKRSK